MEAKEGSGGNNAEGIKGGKNPRIKRRRLIINIVLDIFIVGIVGWMIFSVMGQSPLVALVLFLLFCGTPVLIENILRFWKPKARWSEKKKAENIDKAA